VSSTRIEYEKETSGFDPPGRDIRGDISPIKGRQECIHIYICLVYIITNGIPPFMLLSPSVTDLNGNPNQE
jgi:hypothetical protein